MSAFGIMIICILPYMHKHPVLHVVVAATEQMYSEAHAKQSWISGLRCYVCEHFSIVEISFPPALCSLCREAYGGAVHFGCTDLFTHFFESRLHDTK